MNTNLPYSELREQIISGEIDVVALTQAYIDASKASKTNAVLEVFEESALEQAEKVAAKIKNGTAGRAAGCIIGLKDNICYKNHKVSAASKILNGFESIYNATVVEHLLEEDAIIINRLNCDEFAMGSSNENSSLGNVLNPINNDYVPGGSSGGSAAAVAEGLCMVALGSDTGGSIRQPASYCGVVGYKPTYGLVSRYGLLAYASSFDQIGPFSRNIEDTALITDIIKGNDAYDSTMSQKDHGSVVSEKTKKEKYKIGYITNAVNSKGIDSEIKAHMESWVEELKDAGHDVAGVDFDLIDYMIPNYYILTTAEASSNLARYDGAHYGYRSEEAKDIESTYVKSRSEGFGPEVKRRIMLGTFVLSAGFYDAYYTKALKVRRLIKEKTEKLFEEYDFLILPTAPSTAFKIGENSDDPITMYLQDIFTVHANLAGIPAVSIPHGTHSNGLPFGMQIMSSKFNDADLLSFAKTQITK